jgi:ArsR family transcriptional regulator, virulence genes transcriptional regulator
MTSPHRSLDPPAGPPVISPELVQEYAGEAAQLLKALGNEQRLLILCNLLDGPLSVGELNQRVELSQSALSQHLAVLRELGLVDTRRESQTIIYSLPDGPVVRVMALLQDIYCATGSAPDVDDKPQPAPRAPCDI